MASRGSLHLKNKFTSALNSGNGKLYYRDFYYYFIPFIMIFYYGGTLYYMHVFFKWYFKYL